MKVLHLLVAGNRGGIETLMKNYAMHSTHDNYFVFVWGGGPIAEELKQMGMKTVVLDKRKNGTISTLKSILRICREEKIEMVVSHHSAPLLKVALLCAKAANRRIRIAAYAHANAFDICEGKRRKNLWLRKFIHKSVFAMADGVIAISESVKDSLTEYLGLRRPVKVIYNGVPVREVERQHQPEVEGFPLIYVGRLTEEKGVQTTLKALARIKDEIPFVFYIVGDGPYRKDLESLAEEKGLTDRVCFVGIRAEVTTWLSRSQVFVHMPMWEEGFGITIVEAMVAGCICVCSANGAIPEIITDDESGYLVEKASDAALARKLTEIYSQQGSENLRQMQISARKRAEMFSIERFSRNLDSFMEELRRDA